MEPYSVLLHVDLLDCVPRRGKQRQRIMTFVRSLAEDPYTSDDFTDRDADLRDREVKIIGDYAVTYWVDHPAKSVIVVNVKSADR